MGKKRKEPSEPGALARRGEVIDSRTAGLLFSPEEIARMKLAILTGVEPAGKIEAIRKLTFAPMENSEKGALFLKAIVDPDSAVRREAASALQTLGMGAEFADTLSTVASGTPKQKVLGLSKLKACAPSLGAAERSVALMFLGSSLGYESDREVRGGMLAALAEVIGTTALEEGSAAPLLRAVIKSVAEDYPEGTVAARRLFARLAAMPGGDVAAILWHEVGSIEDRRLRLFLTARLLELPLGPALQADVTAAVAGDIVRDELDDMEARDLRAAFTGLGDAAVEALRSRAAAASEAQRPGLLALMEGAARAGSAQGRIVVMNTFLESWPSAGRASRVAMMESRLLPAADVDPALKGRLAGHIIDSFHTFEDARRADLARSALRHLGPPALDALLDSIDRSPYPVEREAAAQLIGEICASTAVSEARRVELIGRFRALEDGMRIPPGLAVRCTGRLVHRLRTESALAGEVISSFQKRLGRVSFMSDLLVALCHASASPAAPPPAAGEMALKILEFLGGRMPDPTYAETMGPEGRQIEIGRESAVYTELIPDLLEGLQLLYTSTHMPEGLRLRMIDRLLSLWDRVVGYQEIWAPGNLIQLAEALGRMGCVSGGEPRERIMAAMAGSVRNTGVVRALAPLCGDAVERSDAYAERMAGLAVELFRMLGMEEYREMSDRQAILVTLGRIAGSVRIGRDARTGEELRRRIVQRIAEEGAPTAREMVELVEWLSANPLLPPELKAFGPVPARRG